VLKLDPIDPDVRVGGGVIEENDDNHSFNKPKSEAINRHGPKESKQTTPTDNNQQTKLLSTMTTM